MNRSDEIFKTYMNVTRQLSGHLREHYEKWNLTFPQAMVLSILDSRGSMPLGALAEATGSANSTISGVVDRLEKMGQVCRRRSELDHRVIYVDVTDKHREIRGKTTTDVNELFQGILSGLDEQEQQTVLDGLKLLEKMVTPEE